MFHAIAADTLPKEFDFRAAIAFYPGCQRFLAREPKWLPRVPLLFLMGEADNFTPPAPCKELLSRLAASGAPPVESHFYPDAYHAFDHPNSPLRVLTNVKLPPDGRSPTVGTNREAREDAIVRVKQFLAGKLQ
jgi:dienelactone hydrolase